MIKKTILKIFFIYFFLFGISFAEIKIILKIDDEIVTNHDLIKEINYLEILNPNISKLNNNQKIELSKNSLIQQIIKKKEVKKQIDLEKTEIPTDILKNYYQKLGFEKEEDFKDVLKVKKNYTLDEVKKKIKIDLMWSDLIYSKYNNQIKINKEKIENKVDIKKDRIYKDYLLSEIVFAKKKEGSLEKIYNEIKLSIDEIGFANTANIYSISDTSKFGGKIGWINEIKLPKELIYELKNIEIGETTNLIKIANNFLILKIEDIKLEKKPIDREKEIQELINLEINNQLNRFSKIYFDKIKLNYLINEN
jgi:peptidyl-prolyl cis-trans isomerase SurA